jgi:hypothetical protein
MNHNFTFYGTKCNSFEVEAFIKHLIHTNEKAEAGGRRKTPLCIWGLHGIGKTQLVEAFAEQNQYKWRYIAPAQFEEMGDLLGMPHLSTDAQGQESTQMAPPDWVPREEGPGILLIDDVNRADDRILRGIMQLLQNYELSSWKLPARWHIVLTANPDGGDYSVTPMDFAMITRMMHITMEFDVKRWAWWAEKNQIDPRVIAFVLTYPETVQGERTTPRTLTQFAESIADIQDLKANLPLVKMMADACLDNNTVVSFISFINNDLSKLISPEEIMQSKSFEKEVYEPIKAMVMQQVKRVDILSIICTRLVNVLLLEKVPFDAPQLENVKKFLKMDFIPNDLRLIVMKDIAGSNNAKLKKVLQDPELGRLYLQNA